MMRRLRSRDSVIRRLAEAVAPVGRGAAAAAGLAVLLAFSTTAQGAVINVTNTAELEAAITTANGSPGLDTITLAPGVVYTPPRLTISDALVIDGSSAPGAVIEGPSGDCAFMTTAGSSSTFTFKSLTIRSAGTGICYFGYTGDLLDVEDTTITGGGNCVEINIGAARIVNSTLANCNAAIGYETGDPLTLLNDTIVSSFTGFDNFGGPSTVRNTLIAFNRTDCANPPDVSDHNLDSDGSCGSGFVTADPEIGPLGDNGGPTQTFALLSPPLVPAASPAIGAGSSCDPNDQRGVARPTGPCDIGAFQSLPLGVTFATSAGTFTSLSAVPESILPTAGKPSGVSFPFGLFAWTLDGLTPGATVTITITAPSPFVSPAQYWKVIDGVWTDATSLVGSDDGDNVLTLTVTDGGLGDADGVANGQISDPGGVAVPAGPAFVPFASLDARLEREGGRLEVAAAFTLGAGSDGIDPVDEDVSLQVGGFSVTVPAGSFVSEAAGRFRFEGVLQGIHLEILIRSLGQGRFTLTAEMRHIDLSAIVDPVPLTLTVGDDRGTASVHPRRGCEMPPAATLPQGR